MEFTLALFNSLLSANETFHYFAAALTPNMNFHYQTSRIIMRRIKNTIIDKLAGDFIDFISIINSFIILIIVVNFKPSLSLFEFCLMMQKKQNRI